MNIPCIPTCARGKAVPLHTKRKSNVARNSAGQSRFDKEARPRSVFKAIGEGKVAARSTYQHECNGSLWRSPWYFGWFEEQRNLRFSLGEHGTYLQCPAAQQWHDTWRNCSMSAHEEQFVGKMKTLNGVSRSWLTEGSESCPYSNDCMTLGNFSRDVFLLSVIIQLHKAAWKSSAVYVCEKILARIKRMCASVQEFPLLRNNTSRSSQCDHPDDDMERPSRCWDGAVPTSTTLKQWYAFRQFLCSRISQRHFSGKIFLPLFYSSFENVSQTFLGICCVIFVELWQAFNTRLTWQNCFSAFPVFEQLCVWTDILFPGKILSAMGTSKDEWYKSLLFLLPKLL